MGIQINGATDSITAIDGTIDVVSAIGNAGVVTATAFVGNITGNVTGNINHASNLELQVGGVTRGKIDNVGWLGLNQTSKDNAGQVAAFKNTSNGNSWLSVNVNNNTGTGGIVFGDSDNWAPAYIQFNHTHNRMEFHNSGEKLRIDSTGWIGAGQGSRDNAGQVAAFTNNSNSNSWLSVNVANNTGTGGIVFGDSDAWAPAYIQYNHTGNYMQFFSNAIEGLRIDSGGRVKIGTTSNTPAAANEPGIVFGDNTAGTATKGIASFCANGAAPLLLTRRVSDGNVLGIADDTTTRGMVRVNSNDLEITAVEELRLSTGAGHNEKIRLTNAGRFGIGVGGPDAMLHVKGSDNVLGLFESTDADSLIQFKDNGTSDTILMGALGGNDLVLRCDPGNIVFHVANNNERFRIDSSGRLLVGAGAVANPKSSGAGSIDLDNQAFSIIVGGNHPSGGRSNNNAKTFRMSMVHYALAEEPINILQGYCDSSDNNLYIGGGTGSANSLTSARIYTGANTTTTGGTERFRIHSAGQIGLSGANYGTAGQVITSQGSGSAPVWANAGITMTDQWRLTNSYTLPGAVSTINSNWARVASPSGYGKIGSAMSESSGAFTFPATGVYLIEFTILLSATSAQRYLGHRVQTTTNNLNYSTVAEQLGHMALNNSFGAYHTSSSSYVFDVTDTTQCKIRFAGVAFTPSATSFIGNSNSNSTFVTFIRLGDT